MDSNLYCNANQHKRLRYVTDFNDHNFENDFNATIADTSIEGNHMNSDYVYSDIDNQWQNST